MKARTWFRRLLPLCMALILLTAVLYARADEQITAIILPDQEEMTVGDVVQLTLQVNHPAGFRVLPVQPDETWGDFEVRSVSQVAVVANDDGSETSTQTIDATLWAPGTFTTPPLLIRVGDAAGVLQEIEAESASVVVKSVLIEGDDELHDIKPQAALPLPLIWPWIVIGLLLVIVAGWLIRRWRQRMTKNETLVGVPDLRPAYQIALDELARIEALNLPAEGRFKEHYTLVTDVLRHYLEAGHHVPAMDRTTAEIRRALKRLLLPATHRNELLDLLDDADLVKFAKVIPELSPARHFPDRARQFVLMTRPGPEATPSNGESSERAEVVV